MLNQYKVHYELRDEHKRITDESWMIKSARNETDAFKIGMQELDHMHEGISSVTKVELWRAKNDV